MKLTDAERARVAEIKALHAAATPGMWYAVDKGNTVPSHAVMRYATSEKAVNIASGISPKTGNAEFIVNAHGAIPWLISIIDRLAQEPDQSESYRISVDDNGRVTAIIYPDRTVTIAAEPEVVHADWKAPFAGYAVCSNCNEDQQVEMFVGNPTQKWCARCGAKMDGEKEVEHEAD